VTSREYLPWGIELDADQIEPGCAQGWLVGQHRRRPLRGRNQCGEHDGDPDEGWAGGGADRKHRQNHVSATKHCPEMVRGKNAPPQWRKLCSIVKDRAQP
jgi:hypothetical protein